MPRGTLLRIVQVLKILLVRVYLFAAKSLGTDIDALPSSSFVKFLLKSCNSVLSNLFERHARQPLFDDLTNVGSSPVTGASVQLYVDC